MSERARTMEGMTIHVPHRWIAEKMGYSISGISLIRNGHRQPTLRSMEVVEKAFGWPVGDQVEARGRYVQAFEERVSQAYMREQGLVES